MSSPDSRPRAFDARALSRTYDVEAVRHQRREVARLLAPQEGHVVLDVGCGPGHMTAELAAAVGAAGRAIGVDSQSTMLAAAQERVTAAGLDARCVVAAGDAQALPLGTAGCDGAVVVQVLEYVPDVAQALAELRRVLRPGARAVLMDTDWRSCVWHSDDRARTDAVLAAWEAHFAHPQLPALLPGLARAAGFEQADVHAIPLVETQTSTDTYSLGMAAAIARFVGRGDAELAHAWREDVRRQAAAGTYFFSLTRFATVVVA